MPQCPMPGDATDRRANTSVDVAMSVHGLPTRPMSPISGTSRGGWGNGGHIFNFQFTTVTRSIIIIILQDSDRPMKCYYIPSSVGYDWCGTEE